MYKRKKSNKLTKDELDGEAKKVKQCEPLKEVSERVSSLLKKVLESLKKINSHTKRNKKIINYPDVGFDVFYSFYQFGLKCSDTLFKDLLESDEEIKQLNNQVEKLLVTSSNEITHLLAHFPQIYFTKNYSPLIVCQLRSGIQYLFDYLENSTSNNTEVKDLLNMVTRAIQLINEILEKWMLNPDNWVTDKETDIPKTHWWYISPNIKVPTSSLADYPSTNEIFIDC
jgi:hypothetical protein